MRSRILYEDKEVLVAHKPAGIAVQTARTGQADVVSELKNYLCQGRGGLCMATGRQEPYLGIIHRLDQPVEGLLVFAKTRRSAASLTGQLQRQGDEGSFCKRYYAVLCGIPAAREGRLEDCLYKQPVKNGKRTDYISVIKEAGPEMRDSAEGSGRSESSACPEGRAVPKAGAGDRGIAGMQPVIRLPEARAVPETGKGSLLLQKSQKSAGRCWNTVSCRPGKSRGSPWRISASIQAAFTKSAPRWLTRGRLF